MGEMLRKGSTYLGEGGAKLRWFEALLRTLGKLKTRTIQEKESK